jgi:hypothetical protein
VIRKERTTIITKEPKGINHDAKEGNAHHAKAQINFPWACNHEQEAFHPGCNNKPSMEPNSHDSSFQPLQSSL